MQNENEYRIKLTNVYRKTEKATEQTIVNVGGAGSSKSYSLCQFFIFKRLLIKKNYKLLILRKTRHSNKLSVYKMFIDLLEQYGIYKLDNHNRTDLIYTIPENNSYVLFAGLEERERIKSTDWHDIWLEETNEFNREDYTFLKPRLYRGKTEKDFRPRIWFSFNPIDCWIFDYENKSDIKFIYSNYKDNPFCNEEYKKTLEGLKNEDETYYKIYALGERARPKNLIFNPYIIETEYPVFDEVIYGIDWGFNNPTALLQIGIKDNELYLTELLYETHLTKSEIIDKIKILISDKSKYIYPDAEDPEGIEELRRAGFNVYPAEKGKNSVKDSIDVCKRFKIHTKVENINLNKERESYKWKEDKSGNLIDEPVKFRDHLIDAKRYAVFSYFKNKINDIRIRWA